MDEFTAEAFVNQDYDDPSTKHKKEPASSSSPMTGMSKSYQHSDMNTQQDDPESHAPLSLQDRLFAKLLQQVIPAEEEERSGRQALAQPSSRQSSRPAFSLPIMTNNFRRFNARIGIIFVFQNRLIRLFNWRTPTQTLSFMCLYSFVCLDPYLFMVLPVAIVLFFIMIPAFLTRHPPPPSTASGTTPYYSYLGPALAPPKTIRPASETSKDFFRNMRDLQNTMADYSNLHDATVSFLSPLTNFSDENLSSTLFLALSAVTASLFLISHHLPWRLILFITGNVLIMSGHPRAQDFLHLLKRQLSEAEPTQPHMAVTKASSVGDAHWLSLLSSPSLFMSSLKAVADVSLDSYPEEREVEIFELQHRSLAPYSASLEWETLLFSPTPYDPLSPSRIAGDRPRGCRFFEDVQPPSGWAWKSKKWQLDLDCREWVVERMITGVGFEIPDLPGGGSGPGEEVGGWVWDLPPVTSEAQHEDEEFSLMADNESNESTTKPKSDYKGKGKSKTQENVNIMSPSWEYTASPPSGMGEWRRRRWTRLVHRVSIPATEKDKDNDMDRD